ncbi:methyltransferase-like protein 5 isoform X1 [Varroa destructor]|uniref:Methyltransferase-like protein 5 n=2 Tax=Varroa destructor TaxID=109461 RepID=A0A7M7K8L8_VARDE|nr:methyltransferase-like protein 5 isoform X1 [Varroa destructor]
MRHIIYIETRIFRKLDLCESMKMKLKQLKSMLDNVETFDKPNIHLEQYPTPPDIAAEMLYHIWSAGEIENRVVADLGCGGGILSVAAGLLGADYVVAVDIDESSLEICKNNIQEFELTKSVALLQTDVSSLSQILRNPVDTVIMNPPFGTRNKGADLMFVDIASSLCHGSVYSLHKSSTRQHLVRKSEQRGLKCEIIAQLRYNIDRMYKFHRDDTRDVEVDFVRFIKLPQECN